MDEQPAIAAPGEDKHSINWGAFIFWPFVILILYVLTFGPVMRFGSVLMVVVARNKGSIYISDPRNRFSEKFYAPLGWAYNKTPLHKPLGMYMHLWLPRCFDKNGDAPPRI
jgi:hypothetical protein